MPGIIAIPLGGVASSGGSSSGAVAPGDVSAITVTGFIDPLTNAITLTVGVTPPVGGTFIGCHIYLEAPDQSSAPAFTIGTSALGGSQALLGTWVPLDCGQQIYVASQQPWTITIPGPPGLNTNTGIPSRLYAVSFSTNVENKLVQANQASPSPSQTFTLEPITGSTSGTNITTLTVASGAQVGLVVTALTPVNVTGKLETPFIAIVTDTPVIPGWSFQLVLTYAGQDPTLAANQFVMTGLFTQAGIVQAGADGVAIPHSFIIDTPTVVTRATVWLQAGLVDASGNFQANNIVPGITPGFPVVYGSTVGTTDASAIMTATITASMAIVSGLFGVAAAGITNSLLGSGAVATINVQALAITNPLLASLAVQAANLASGSVTATAIAALAVGTGAIQTAAITNALIANLAVSSAQIQSATILGANIASATIAGANIATATIAQANMASASIGTAQIQSLAVTDAKINDLSAGKLTAGTISATISITSPTITCTNGFLVTAGGTTTSINNATFSPTGRSSGLACANGTFEAAVDYLGLVSVDTANFSSASIGATSSGGGIELSNASATHAINISFGGGSTPGVAIDSNQVLSTRVATTPVTLADVIAVLQHHGLSN